MSALKYILPLIENEEMRFKKYLNLLILLMERKERTEKVSGKPIDVTIDPSTICQLSCPYCGTGNGTIKRKKTFLSKDTNTKYIDEIGDGLFVSWYFSTGEPLLNKDLSEIISANRKKNVFTVISTNLSVNLTDDKIDELLKSGIGLISASIDGATAESYSKYRRKGNFSLVINNLKKLVQRKKILGLEYPLIQWRFLIFKHNENEIDKVRELARKIGVDIVEFFYGYAPQDENEFGINPSKVRVDGPMISGEAIEKSLLKQDTFLKKYIKEKEIIDYEPEIPDVKLRSQKCDWLYFGGMIFPDGRISPCCVSNDEPDDFGELSDNNSILNVRNNSKFIRARKMFKNNIVDKDLVCSRCLLPLSQDYQFRDTLKAVLLNAPEWVIKVISEDSDLFFYDIDYNISPAQIGIFKSNHEDFKFNKNKFASVIDMLEDSKKYTNDSKIDMIIKLLKK
ncbi:MULTISPECIES: radical SAM protein [Clostridium]|uniref:radical SAM protein n=1 Tax=Clostridium TaxID=1485 RepID=UPI0008268020|nr:MULTISPECIES: radical SAM/SPASM domain-containing protein [Clostridium]PJI09847.1 radical SAM/SPASM domain-containing protein [Clostridium sp. CT7]